MSWFCAHNWTTVQVTYAPPTDAISSVKGWPGAVKPILERAVHGVTTVLLQCSKCRRLKTVEMLGAPVEGKP